MHLDMVARTIQLIIAPAVMITSCCIVTNGLLAHYAAIGERWRVSVRERVDLLRETEASKPYDLGRVLHPDVPRSEGRSWQQTLVSSSHMINPRRPGSALNRWGQNSINWITDVR